MLFRSLCFCLAVIGATTASAQQVEFNGQVGTFVPAQTQPDQGEYSVVQPRQAAPSQGPSFGPNGLPICREVVISDEVKIERKILERHTHVRVIEKVLPTERHALPIQRQVPADPCLRQPPRDPCVTVQQHHQHHAQGPTDPCPSGGAMRPWYMNWGFHNPCVPNRQGQQLPRQPVRYYGSSGGGSMASVNVNASVMGFGPRVSAGFGRQP